MQEVKTFYDTTEGGAARKINDYLMEHPDYRITHVSSTQVTTRQATRLCITVVFESKA